MVHGIDAAGAATRVETLDDPRLQGYRKVAEPAALARAGLFVAEGRWVVERLLAQSRFATRSVLVTPTAFAAMTAALAPAVRASVPIYIAEPALLNELVGFNMHRGCLALAERPQPQALTPAILERARRILALEGVNNPDNVGGVFRSAAAFDVDLVVLGPACGDPLYRKAIRTSMAATLDVPYVMAPEWPAGISALREAGFYVAALTPSLDAAPLDSLTHVDRAALLIGTEGAGLTPAALAHADGRVRIPTTDRVDSLNATVAASIAMHFLFARGLTPRR